MRFLIQLDGNISLNSENENSSSGNQIPVHISLRSAQPETIERLPFVRKYIRRDNKVLQAISLPKLSSYNMRSLIPKIENFGRDFQDRMCNLAFLCEIWEKSENKQHQFKIEELLEIRGIKYISTPRPGARRGGGAALAADSVQFNLEKLPISIPHGLEIVWGILTPKEITGKIKKIIVSCFYSPPRQAPI